MKNDLQLKNKFYEIIKMTLRICLLIILSQQTSVPLLSAEPFQPDRGIHPYYLNQVPGYNFSECKEKEKCRKECPEIERKQSFTRSLTEVYLRNECLRKCDQMSCKLNSFRWNTYNATIAKVSAWPSSA